MKVTNLALAAEWPMRMVSARCFTWNDASAAILHIVMMPTTTIYLRRCFRKAVIFFVHYQIAHISMFRGRLRSAAFCSSRTFATAVSASVRWHARSCQGRVVPIIPCAASRTIRPIRTIGQRGMGANSAAYGSKIWTNAVLWAYVALAAFGTGSEIAHGTKFA